jgi:hypothetical protein
MSVDHVGSMHRELSEHEVHGRVISRTLNSAFDGTINRYCYCTGEFLISFMQQLIRQLVDFMDPYNFYLKHFSVM